MSSNMEQLAPKLYPYLWAMCFFSSVCFIYDLLVDNVYPILVDQLFLSGSVALGTVLLAVRIKELFL